MADTRAERDISKKSENGNGGELEKNLDEKVDRKLDGNPDDKAGQIVRYATRVILILMKVGISTSTWFQVVPVCSLISKTGTVLKSVNGLEQLEAM